MAKKKILIVGFDNVCLSPMIQALLSQALNELGLIMYYTIESAGLANTHPDGNPPTEFTVCVMNEKADLCIAHHTSRSIKSLRLSDYYQFFVTNQERLSRLIRLGAPTEKVTLLFESSGGIHLDPMANKPSYEQCVALLKPEIRKIAQEIAAEHRTQQRQETTRRAIALDVTRKPSPLSR